MSHEAGKQGFGDRQEREAVTVTRALGQQRKCVSGDQLTRTVLTGKDTGKITAKKVRLMLPSFPLSQWHSRSEEPVASARVQLTSGSQWQSGSKPLSSRYRYATDAQTHTLPGSLERSSSCGEGLPDFSSLAGSRDRDRE